MPFVTARTIHEDDIVKKGGVQTVRPIVNERIRYGEPRQLDRPIVYDGDGDGQDYMPPHLAIGILDSLFGRKAINDDEKLAGERFGAWFQLAQLEQLRAADMARPFVDGGGAAPELGAQNERARREVARAIRWVGKTGGSCLWHVIGLDQPLRRWCQEQANTSLGRVLHHNGAAGVLIVTLEKLAAMPWTGPWEKSP